MVDMKYAKAAMLSVVAVIIVALQLTFMFGPAIQSVFGGQSEMSVRESDLWQMVCAELDVPLDSDPLSVFEKINAESLMTANTVSQ
jgi:hypothetical protein